MTASTDEEQGRLRSILHNWQGEPVFLTFSSSTISIHPQYLDQTFTANAYKKKFTNLLKRDVFGHQNMVEKHHSRKQHTKTHKKFFNTENDYVFSAPQRSKSKKGKSFSQLAEQYGSRRQREERQQSRVYAQRKNKTNSHNQDYQFQFPKCSLKPVKKYPKYVIPDEGHVEQQISLKIEESLKEMGTHFSEGMVRKIQLLKKEMVEKIVEEGCESPQEFGEIINEIRLATERIISNHSRKHSELQMTQANFDKKIQPSDNPTLQKQLFSFEGDKNEKLEDQLPEKVTEDKCSMIKLPEFVDESGKISSILSENNSLNKEENDQKIVFNEIKQDCQEIEEEKPEIPNEANVIIEEKTQKNEENKVELQKSPQIKDYKIQFIDSRVKQSEIVRLSPLRFRRKEEVVKHLVKHRIVEKQSNSFEFVH